jgi:hypothetical protein
MKTSMDEKKSEIQWTMWNQLDIFDFADDLEFLSHNHQMVQEKMDRSSLTFLRVMQRLTHRRMNLIIHTSSNPDFGHGDRSFG